MREKFIDKNFRADTLDFIDTANEIIDAYQKQGFVLTLRQHVVTQLGSRGP